MVGSLKQRLKIVARRLLFASLVPGIVAASYVFLEVRHSNFHVVSAGQIYRSAQMDGDGLARAVLEHGIKSVVNLRGQNVNQDWYRAEIDTARQMGVQHFDFALSASREVGDAEMEQILDTIDRAPKPLLVHCKSGADRTGLVGALYLFAIEGRSPESADCELTLFYGHFPHLFWRDTIAMDRSYWRYVSKHLQQSNLKSRDLSGSLTKRVTGASAGDGPTNHLPE